MLPPLYPILDIDLCRERRLEPLAILDGFLTGGARLVQLRDKNPSTSARLALADRAVARARAGGAALPNTPPPPPPPWRGAGGGRGAGGVWGGGGAGLRPARGGAFPLG